MAFWEGLCIYLWQGYLLRARSVHTFFGKGPSNDCCPALSIEDRIVLHHEWEAHQEVASWNTKLVLPMAKISDAI